METKFNIVSHEAISRNYLQLHIQTNDKPCGSVDFIAERSTLIFLIGGISLKVWKQSRISNCSIQEGI